MSEQTEPFVLDFANGTIVEQILKKAYALPTNQQLTQYLDAKADKTTVEAALADKAAKATTLAGYGITDAYTKTQVDSALQNDIDYDNLQDKPKINDVPLAGNLSAADLGLAAAGDVPTVGSGVLTIQKNGTKVDDFSANATANKTINITVPTQASDVDAIPSTAKGAINGVAELDSSGKVPAAQVPSDIAEYSSTSAFPNSGVANRIYLAKDTDKLYRWTGSAYTEVSKSLELGETSTTAYPGDLGKANATAIANMKDGTSIDSFGDVEAALVLKATAANLEAEATARASADTKQVAAIAELVNKSSKNRLPISSGTGTATFDIPVSLPAGTYEVYFGSISSTDTDYSTCQVIALQGNTVVSTSPQLQMSRGSDVHGTITISSACNKIQIYASKNGTAATGDTVTFSNAMLCTAVDWSMSETYVPHDFSPEALVQLINTSNKNALKLDGAVEYSDSVASSTLEFTINSDYSIKITGKAGTSAAFLHIPVTIPVGEYIFTGMPEAGGSDSYRLELRTSKQSGLFKTCENTDGTPVSVTSTWSGYFNIRIAANYDFGASGKTVYPMLSDPSEYAVTNQYVPHDSTVEDLVVAAKTLLAGESKNMLDLSGLAASMTINGVTWTVDANAGTITADTGSGSASANSFFYIWPANTNKPISANTLLSGSAAAGSATKWELQAAIGYTVYHDYGDGCTVPAGTIKYITCCVRSGQQVSGLVFKPMLAFKALTDIDASFALYHPPLGAMWNAIRAIQ